MDPAGLWTCWQSRQSFKLGLNDRPGLLPISSPLATAPSLPARGGEKHEASARAQCATVNLKIKPKMMGEQKESYSQLLLVDEYIITCDTELLLIHCPRLPLSSLQRALSGSFFRHRVLVPFQQTITWFWNKLFYLHLYKSPFKLINFFLLGFWLTSLEPFMYPELHI